MNAHYSKQIDLIEQMQTDMKILHQQLNSNKDDYRFSLVQMDDRKMMHNLISPLLGTLYPKLAAKVEKFDEVFEIARNETEKMKKTIEAAAEAAANLEKNSDYYN